ncbi:MULTISPECIES: helix-turn-helix domain-containing protein [Halobacillus]|uniref:helix-turn-helix domain-containing protein n=1 Tax=Halobacillus TaxID=45667 RepID=UPI0009A63DDF|nr:MULTISPECIES: helix-turn-helix transcriptional regulator [Halobacillus]
MTTIGERIRVLRLGQGYTVNQFAKMSGVSKSYISNIERGIQRNPSLIVMKKFADTLNVPLEELLLINQTYNNYQAK